MGHNYSKYSSKEKREKLQTAEQEPVMETSVEETVTEEPKTRPLIFGKVANCIKLNVREKPDVNANVICEIFAGATVIIDEDETTEKFFKVCTEAGLYGFCMKDYIYIDQ